MIRPVKGSVEIVRKQDVFCDQCKKRLGGHNYQDFNDDKKLVRLTKDYGYGETSSYVFCSLECFLAHSGNGYSIGEDWEVIIEGKEVEKLIKVLKL